MKKQALRHKVAEMTSEIEAYKTRYTFAKVDDNVNGILFYSPSTVEKLYE